MSKNKIKLIRALQQKKYRKKHGIFVVEGEKMVAELLDSSYTIEAIYALPEWEVPQKVEPLVTSITAKELKGISTLQTPNKVLALVHIPNVIADTKVIQQNLSLALSNLQDPGNLGTIIRTADWFGLPYVFCSTNCVDVYNTKVIQATMGSIFRTKVIYTDLEALFQSHSTVAVYGALLEGKNIFDQQNAFQQKGFILIGNESKGIAATLRSLITHPITIPRIGQAESLNAAVAASIICAAARFNV